MELVLVDLNPQMVRAWNGVFHDVPDVRVVQGSLLAQRVNAWVSPGNSAGRMDGGLDAAIRQHLGNAVQLRLRRAIVSQFGGSVPVGYATCVETGRAQPNYLVSTPTMVRSAEDIGETFHAALAFGAALFAAEQRNREAPGSIQTLAVPGLGTGTGQVPHEVCAELMWLALHAFRHGAFRSFEDVSAAVMQELGIIDGSLSPMNDTYSRSPYRAIA